MIRGLGKDAKVHGSHVLIRGIDGRSSVDVEFQQGELLEKFRTQCLLDLIFCVFGLFLDVQTDEVNVIFRLVSSGRSDSV